MPSSVAQQFLDVFPHAFLIKIPHIVTMSYAEAERIAMQFEAPEAHDLRPIVRRAFVEQALRATAQYHGLRAEARENEIGNCYHTFVESPPFSLTESAVPSPETVVRWSIFREGYSRQNENLSLFGEEDSGAAADQLYGIVLHGPHPKEWEKPGFVWVRFPVPGLDGYFPERIDLQRLAEGRYVDLDVPQSEVEDEVAIEIAEHLRKLREAGEG